MLTVHLESGRISARNAPMPRPPKGFALIRLIAAGICSTDLELQRGYYGFRGTPGHEFVGEVVAVSDEAAAPAPKSKGKGAGKSKTRRVNADDKEPVSVKKWLGARVVGEINLACGHCDWCARGLGRHCPTRKVLGIVNHPGAFSEYLTLPLRNLHRVPNSISDEQAVFIEPIAAACQILDQVKIPAGGNVALLGDGKLGLLIAQVLQASGAQVHMFGRHKAKMRLAERAGATAEVVPVKLPERAYRWVVDATGSSEGLTAAAVMCEPRGTIIIKSTMHGAVSINTAPLVVNEVTMIGSRCGRFQPAIRLLQQGKINLTGFISHEYSLQHAEHAFARAGTRGVLKVLLRPPA